MENKIFLHEYKMKKIKINEKLRISYNLLVAEATILYYILCCVVGYKWSKRKKLKFFFLFFLNHQLISFCVFHFPSFRTFILFLCKKDRKKRNKKKKLAMSMCHNFIFFIVHRAKRNETNEKLYDIFYYNILYLLYIVYI